MKKWSSCILIAALLLLPLAAKAETNAAKNPVSPRTQKVCETIFLITGVGVVQESVRPGESGVN